MKRLVTTALAIGVFAAIPAHAGISGDLEGDYEGRIEKDTTTFFGFDKAGKQLKNFEAELGYQCDDGNDFPSVVTETVGELEPNEAGRFAGKTTYNYESWRRGDGNTTVTYRIKGKLLSGGKAKGTLDAEIKNTMTGRRCYSGVVNWQAEKGADTSPPR